MTDSMKVVAVTVFGASALALFAFTTNVNGQDVSVFDDKVSPVAEQRVLITKRTTEDKVIYNGTLEEIDLEIQDLTDQIDTLQARKDAALEIKATMEAELSKLPERSEK